MAIANLSPPDRIRSDYQDQLRSGLRSIDPVERFKAREQILNDNITRAGCALVKRSKAIGSAFIARQIQYDQSDRNPPKYKTFPR